MWERIDFKCFSKIVREALKDIKKDDIKNFELTILQWLKEIEMRIK
jgi:hypothetical protein